MFGLSGNKKQNEDFLFDLEVEVKQPTKGRELKDKVISRAKQLKQLLRSGKDQEEFNKLGTLLLGYTALHKVIARLQKK